MGFSHEPISVTAAAYFAFNGGHEKLQERHSESTSSHPSHPSLVTQGHLLKDAELLCVLGTVPIEPSINMHASTTRNLTFFMFCSLKDRLIVGKWTTGTRDHPMLLQVH